MSTPLPDPFDGWDPLSGGTGVGHKSNAISGAVRRARELLANRGAADITMAASQLEQLINGYVERQDYTEDGFGGLEKPERVLMNDWEWLDHAITEGLLKTNPILKSWRRHQMYAVLALVAARQALKAPLPRDGPTKINVTKGGLPDFWVYGAAYEPFGEAYECVARAETAATVSATRGRGGLAAKRTIAQARGDRNQKIVTLARSHLMYGKAPKDLAAMLARRFEITAAQVRRILQGAGILRKRKRNTL